MSIKMTPERVRDFLMSGTMTGKLATVRADGRPHVAPIWFVLDGDDLVFNTADTSVKGKNLARDNRVAISVDDQTPPYAFAIIEGRAELSRDQDELIHWQRRSDAGTWVTTGRWSLVGVTVYPASGWFG